jgi:rhodanese-related sulfurtransferase
MAAKSRYYAAAQAPETISRAGLAKRLAAGDVVLLDVRPADEFSAGHIPGAQSIPIVQLGERLDELPGAALVVATCRGPYCVFAAEAVQLLRRSGRPAVRFEGSVADWAFDGGTLVTGPVQ